MIPGLRGPSLEAKGNRGCVTPRQIENIKESIDEDVDMLDGYDEIPPDLQEKIKAAIENGHVNNEDWNGVCSDVPRDERKSLNILRTWNKIGQAHLGSELPRARRPQAVTM